jgi:hypothetical protein
MNWLDKYQAVISCDKRTIKLVSPLGEEVVTELVPPRPKKGSCYQMAVDSSEADPIEIIKVVSEFPDVFPKDLPGMPPERKVEFAIELLPGTAPIFKRAYRVTQRKTIRMCKVRRSHHSEEEATWERENDLMAKYPELFASQP